MSTFLPLIPMTRSPQSSPTVLTSLSLNLRSVNWRMMEDLPTLLSPMSMNLTISSQGRPCMFSLAEYVLQDWMHGGKGKIIKDYTVGDLVAGVECQLAEGRKANGTEVSLVVIEKRYLENSSFLSYNNMLQENVQGVHPQYVEIIQSTSNIYIILEKLTKPLAAADPLALLPSFLRLYRSMGEYKFDPADIYLTAHAQLVYLPLYKRVQMTSKFYAQFHNKSVLADLLSTLLPQIPKNTLLDIFIRNVDLPDAAALIAHDIRKAQGEEVGSYPEVEEEEPDDEEIMQLMSQVKVNSNMKKEAGEQFIRQSARRGEGEDGEMANIMEKVESSMFAIKGVKSGTDKTKLEVRLGESKMQGVVETREREFDLYFKSYCESLRFLKRSIKRFISSYKGSFAGIVSSFLLSMVVTLRKAYLIRELETRNDVFDLGYNISCLNLDKYIRFLKRDLRSEARMIAEFRNLIEGCRMPVKTFGILAPFLEEDLASVDFVQLQTFTFFFLSALLKKWEGKDLVGLHMIEVMYILLHRNYEIVFFESDFPAQWSQSYFDMKVALIQSLLPNWSL